MIGARKYPSTGKAKMARATTATAEMMPQVIFQLSRKTKPITRMNKTAIRIKNNIFLTSSCSSICWAFLKERRANDKDFVIMNEVIVRQSPIAWAFLKERRANDNHFAIQDEVIVRLRGKYL